MCKAKNLIGKTFGRLTVIDVVKCDGKTKCKCQCTCGNISYVMPYSLTSGGTKSCGCYMNEARYLRGNQINKTRLHRIWAGMKSRCSNSKDPHYKNYGGRGIKVCEEWQKFFPFYKWSMDNGYDDELTIDRIDVNGGYCPENCRWITKNEQSKNKTNSKYLTYNGKTMIQADLAREYNIDIGTFHGRLKAGWSLEEALTKEPNRKMVEFNGKKVYLGELAKEYGISEATLRFRLKKGWDIKEALETSTSPTIIEYNGEKHTVSEWSEITGFNTNLIRSRIKKGWSIEEALTLKPEVGRNQYSRK